MSGYKYTQSDNGLFRGVFDGQGYTVSGLVSDMPLFKRVNKGAEVKNLIIEDSKFTQAVIAGNNSGIIGCCSLINTEVSGTGIIGGFTSQNMDGGVIKNCAFRGTLSEQSGVHSKGAMTGLNFGEIYNSYSLGGNLYEENNGTVLNCYSSDELMPSQDMDELLLELNLRLHDDWLSWEIRPQESPYPQLVKIVRLNQCPVELSSDSYVYDGIEKYPDVKVTYGDKEPVRDRDYELVFSDNIDAGTAKVKVCGLRQYVGYVECLFVIDRADISNAGVSPDVQSYIYDGSAKKPGVTVKVGNKTLIFDKDYTVSYSNNIKVGTAKVKVTGKGNYFGSKEISFKIVEAPKITCKKTVYKVAYGAKPFKINATSNSKMTFTSSKPKIAAVDKNTGKVTIKNTGVATITIRAGKASKKVTIRVSPKKPSVKSANTAKGKKLIVKWAKDKMAPGYQVQISTDKKFKKNVKSKNLSKTSYTFTKLKTGKKYYVRMCSYKKFGKETLYSAWSKAKVSGKVKK